MAPEHFAKERRLPSARRALHRAMISRIGRLRRLVQYRLARLVQRWVNPSTASEAGSAGASFGLAPDKPALPVACGTAVGESRHSASGTNALLWLGLETHRLGDVGPCWGRRGLLPNVHRLRVDSGDLPEAAVKKRRRSRTRIAQSPTPAAFTQSSVSHRFYSTTTCSRAVARACCKCALGGVLSESLGEGKDGAAARDRGCAAGEWRPQKIAERGGWMGLRWQPNREGPTSGWAGGHGGGLAVLWADVASPSTLTIANSGRSSAPFGCKTLGPYFGPTTAAFMSMLCRDDAGLLST